MVEFLEATAKALSRRGFEATKASGADASLDRVRQVHEIPARAPD